MGHMGTLDPFAGVDDFMRAKRLKCQLDFTPSTTTAYEATYYLGQVSSTGDPGCELTDVSDKAQLR